MESGAWIRDGQGYLSQEGWVSFLPKRRMVISSMGLWGVAYTKWSVLLCLIPNPASSSYGGYLEDELDRHQTIEQTFPQLRRGGDDPSLHDAVSARLDQILYRP